MELTVLGSGTVAPDPARTAPAFWVEGAGTRLLLDCGAGMLHRAAEFAVPWHTVTHVALTHFHADHWGELAMLLFALRWGVEPSREAPLTLIGPTGLDARLTLLAGAMGDWVRYPDYPMDVVQVRPDQTLALADAVSLEAFKTPHTIESLAYAVRHDGARLVYTGDTGPCDELAAWARGADVLLSECSLPAARAMDIHLTPEQAGRLARAARVRRLILTHRYPMLGAREAAEGAASEFDGEIVVARDGDRFVIERRKDAKTEGPKEETTEGRKE